MSDVDFSNFYLFDIIVAVGVLFSAIRAFVRGFTFEIFGIIAWVGSIVLSLKSPQYFQSYIESFLTRINYTTLIPIATEITIGIAFVVSLVTLLLIVQTLSRLIRGSALGLIDRVLGFTWGGFRGLLIFVIIYFMTLSYVPDFLAAQKKSWLNDSVAFNVIESFVEKIKQLRTLDYIKDFFEFESEIKDKDLNGRINKPSSFNIL